MLRSRLVMQLGFALAVSLFAGACVVEPNLPSDEGVEHSVADTSEPITVDEVLARAQLWLDAKVPYCGGVRNGTDYICGGTCSRPAAAWDAYRSDCSGFVSWSWGLPGPGWDTGTFVAKIGGSVKQLNVDQLEPGDAIVTTAKGHIVLFRRWITANKRIEVWEESSCGQVAHSKEVNITINSPTVLHLGTDTRAFTPIRYASITGCVPGTEVCNGKDDNCDGQIDEGNVCNSPIDSGVADTGTADSGKIDSAVDSGKVDSAGESDTSTVDAIQSDSAPDTDGGSILDDSGPLPVDSGLPDSAKSQGIVGTSQDGGCSLSHATPNFGLGLLASCGLLAARALRRRKPSAASPAD